MNKLIKIPSICTLAVALLVIAAVSWGADQDCLSCHADIKKVGPGRVIDPQKYSHTAHAQLAAGNFGCRTCHDAISSMHPEDGMKVTATTACNNCHMEEVNDYYKSRHAKNARCGDCHDPHAAYAPTEVSGQDMNKMCANCHDNGKMVSRHAEWLPQAELHIDSLPCITCHSASENYVVTMYIVKREDGSQYGEFKTASHEELKALTRGGDIRSLIDTNSDGYVSLAELKLFNTGQRHESVRLKGMMTPEVVTHDFQVLKNRYNCSFCHASGPGAMQTTFLAVPQADGTFARAQVEKGAVLDAVYGTPDFYMLGSTRNSTLDKIGLLIIAGGLIMPIGHGSLRFLTRKNRSGKGH